MRVYIFRHGETDWNASKRVQGQSDIELNQNGIDLAKEVAKVVRTIPFNYAFSSPLKRTRLTAEILLEGSGIEIKYDDRLKEIGFGVEEGLEPEKRRPEFDNFFKAPEKYVPAEGGETLEHLNARIADFIEDVLVPLSIKEPDATVLISGHGAMGRGFKQYFGKEKISQFWDGLFSVNLSCIIYEVNGNEARMIKDYHLLTEEV